MTNNYITSRDTSGKAIFSTKAPTAHLQIPIFPGGSLDLGSLQCIYSTEEFQPHMSSERDIEQYAKIREEGLPAGQYAPSSGVIINIVEMGAGWESPWHVTPTLDTLVIIEGVIELYLDGGEFRTLAKGDSIVQRATKHKWKNVTPNGGVVRMFAVSQPVVLVGSQEEGL